MKILRLMVFVCLLAPWLANAQSRNPYDLELQRLQSRWASAGDLERLVLLNRILQLYDYVDDRAQIRTILKLAANAADAGDGKIQAAREAGIYLQELQAANGSAVELQEHWYKLEQRRQQVLAQALQLPAGNAGNLDIAAEIETIAGSPAAVDHLKQAASLSPTTDRWARLAEVSDNSLVQFAALQSGLSLDPENVRINLLLTDYYVRRQQLEKARDLLKKAAADSPEDYVPREKLAEVTMRLGLRSEALRELKILEKAWPEPLWLRSRLAKNYEQIGLLDDAVRLAAALVRENPNDRDSWELLARFHAARHLIPALETDYSALVRIDSGSAQFWSDLAQAQNEAGHFDAAKISLERLLVLDGSSSETHLRLAQVNSKLHRGAEAQQELAAASKPPSKTIAGDPDQEFLSDSRAVAESTFRNPPQEADVALSNIRVQQLYETGVDRVHVQQIYFVGSEMAVEAHRFASVRYSPGSEQLRIVHARAWSADGRVTQAQDLGDRELGDSASSMYYDTRLRELRFPSLQKGDVVELEYSIIPTLEASPYRGYFGDMVAFAGQASTLFRRYVLIAPKQQKIFTHAEKLAPAALEQRADSQIFTWEAHSLPALPREARSPGVSEVAPYVLVSTVGDWKQLGAWYAELIRPQFSLDQTLQQELAALVRGKHNDREKIAAIQEFVLRSTHYVALEFGIYSYKPYPVAQVYARRFGDCKDKASLMIALLRAAGIDADLALVRTRALGETPAQPASIAVFNHAIVYIPKYDLWLDGTAEYAGRELPQEDQGVLALTVGLSGAAQLRRIPVSRASDNYTHHNIQAQITREGVIRFSGSTLTRGEDAPGLRHELAERRERLNLFRRDLAQVFPTIEVDSVAVHGAEDLASDVSVDFQGALNLFRRKKIVALSSSWMLRSYVAALAPSSARTQDLVLFSPWITEEEIHVAIPAGAEIGELPRDQNISNNFGSLKLHYRKTANEVVIQSHVEFDKARISAADYPAFRAFCAQVERSFRNEITVGLPQ